MSMTDTLVRSLKTRSYRLRRRIAASIFPAATRIDQSQASYSAAGEDLVAMAWLQRAGIHPSAVRYLDIGAADPIKLSNTYLFWTRGACGVLVEPDPDQAAKLRSRTRDIVVNAGVAFDDRTSATLIRLKTRLFNTFSEDYAAHVIDQSKTWDGSHEAVVDRIEVKLIDINALIDTYMAGIAPHFLSLDTESFDFQILRSLDFSRFRPTVICSELSFPLQDFKELLNPHGYELVCRTPDNALFYRSIADAR
jgi:hypothetical protein